MYIFKSARLGFRNWTKDDITEFAEINSDSEVMKHFPKSLTKDETKKSIQRYQRHFKEFEYTYFATEILETGEFIGFIGLLYQRYETAFAPATDIGWRLKKTVWGKGYATEGAKRCLEYALTTLRLNRIVAICTKNNTGSENVMKKIGMIKMGEFNHPNLKEYPEYEKCIWYEIKKEGSR